MTSGDDHDGGGGGNISGATTQIAPPSTPPARAPDGAAITASGHAAAFAQTAAAPAGDGARDAEGPDLPATDEARWQMGAEIARGGLGRVMRGYDRRLGRDVAIKELLARERDAEARFVREAIITARLQHPSIVPIYEAGRRADGAPFYAMRRVTGRSLEALLGETRSLDDRLALLSSVIAVVDAVAYAHSRRIIHRDLKPANVLVGSFGETVVIDWGLAKDIGTTNRLTDGAGPDPSRPSRPAPAGHTVAGVVMGTPAYMAPEQATGRPVDERTDVYALGAMLYHVVCGSAPVVGSSTEEVLTRVRHGRIEPPESRAPDAPRDLCAVISKAMALEPAARYPTASELAADLRRFQAGHAVSVHRYSGAALARRWAQRNRGALATVSVGGLAMALIVGATISEMGRVTDRADRERAALLTFARAAGADRDKAVAVVDRLALQQARAELARDPAAALAALRDLSPGASQWTDARLLALGAHAALAPDAGVRLLHGHTGRVEALAFARGIGQLASGGDDGSVRLWTLPDGAPATQWQGQAGPVLALAFSPTAKWVAIGMQSGAVNLWEPGKGSAHELLEPAHGPARAVAFSHDGARVAAGGDDGAVRVIEWQKSAPRLWTLAGSHEPIAGLEWSLDGSLAAWAARGPELLWPNAEGPAKARPRSPERDTPVRASSRHAVASLEAGALCLETPPAHGKVRLAGVDDARRVALASEGALIALAGERGFLALWVDDLPRDSDALYAWLQDPANVPPPAAQTPQAQSPAPRPQSP